MKIGFNVECPYCGSAQIILVDDLRGSMVVSCERIDGCDRDYAIDWVISETVTTRKIESDESQ